LQVNPNNKKRRKKMIFGKKKAKAKDNRSNERLVRKVLGKDTGRKAFGFPCSPDIPARLKAMADRLHVPLYALSEHCLQLGASQLAKTAENTEEAEFLRQHISDIHVGRRTIEKISRYDEEMADVLDRERSKRFQFEQEVRQITMKYYRPGTRPSELSWAIDYGLRCRIAVATGQPLPKDFPPEKD
jgi:CMP-2-keto-3-deoxyoctulosonic acid synthetase